MGSAPSPRRGRSRHVFALAFAIAAFFGLSDRAAHGQVARTLTPGELRAISGNLTYPLPAGTDPSAYAGVIVYCVEYSMIFTAAPLR